MCWLHRRLVADNCDISFTEKISRRSRDGNEERAWPGLEDNDLVAVSHYDTAQVIVCHHRADVIRHSIAIIRIVSSTSPVLVAVGLRKILRFFCENRLTFGEVIGKSGSGSSCRKGCEGNYRPSGK